MTVDELFQSAAPLREPTTSAHAIVRVDARFQSAAPLREPTRCVGRPWPRRTGFNPRLPCGSRPWASSKMMVVTVFQSAAPLREPTVAGESLESSNTMFQSAAPLREPTFVLVILGSTIGVSIRGSLAGADELGEVVAVAQLVSIRGSLAGADLPAAPAARTGACFNPRLPCGSRRVTVAVGDYKTMFQSAAPLREPTVAGESLESSNTMFQSAAPLREPTTARCPRASGPPCFNPRLPCGSRRAFKYIWRWRYKFQSAAPLREPTAHRIGKAARGEVSIRGSLAGADEPRGLWRGLDRVSIRGSLAGADPGGEQRDSSAHVSIRGSLAGADRYILVMSIAGTVKNLAQIASSPYLGRRHDPHFSSSDTSR